MDNTDEKGVSDRKFGSSVAVLDKKEAVGRRLRYVAVGGNPMFEWSRGLDVFRWMRRSHSEEVIISYFIDSPDRMVQSLGESSDPEPAASAKKSRFWIFE